MLKEELKICIRCKSIMPTHRKNKYCTECLRAYGKQYYATHKTERKAYAVKNRNKISAYKRKYNAEHTEERNAKQKQYYRAHRDEILKYQKQYYRLNQEEVKNRSKEWSEANRERVNESARNRRDDDRARLKMVVRSKTNHILKNSRKNAMCKICGDKAVEFHHHVYDLNNPTNGIFVCKKCHLAIHGEL